MPSKLKPTLRVPDISFRDTLKPQLVRIKAFFEGLNLDASPWAVGGLSAIELTNILYRGEHLSTDYGFRLLVGANTNFRMGDQPAAYGYTNAAEGYNSNLSWAHNAYTAPPPPFDGFIPQLIAGLSRFARLGTAGRVAVAQIIVTARHNPVLDAEEVAHVFEMSTAATSLTGRQFESHNGATAAPDKVLGSRPILADNTKVYQFANYAGGLSGSSAATGGFNVWKCDESVLFFTNDFDDIMYYPDKTGSTNYTSFMCRATQLTNFVNACPADPLKAVPTFTNFKCRSLCQFDGRMLYLNTVEGSVRYNQRLRWSTIGDATIVWPTFYINDPNYTANGVGAGWMDFYEFSEEGQCVMPIGNDTVAVYFRDGVAFLTRTGIPTAPYSREYISRNRGLIGQNAVCDLGGGVHFGLFNDGWYILSGAGAWREVGLVKEQQSLEEALVFTSERRAAYKWKEYFYTHLDMRYAHKVHCQFDQWGKVVRILWPDKYSIGGLPNRLWTWDPQNDRLTETDYSNVGGHNLTPTCMGPTDLSIGPATSWDAYPNQWDQAPATERTWDSYQSQSLEVGWAHGCADGTAMQHDPALGTYYNEPVPWSMALKPNSLGAPERLKVADRVWVEYEQTDQVSAAIQVEGWDGPGNHPIQAGSVNLAKGNPGDPGVDYADFRVTGHNLAVRIAGSGQMRIRSFSMQLLVQAGDSNEFEGSIPP